MKKLVSSVLAASMVLSLAACGSSASTDTASSSEAASTSTAATTEAAGEDSGAYTGTPIKIGGIGPVTGGAAIYGQAVKNAEELAVKEINAANGSDVFEWKFEDDEHDAEKSVNAYNTLKDWGLQVLAGPVTTTPSIAVAAENPPIKVIKAMVLAPSDIGRARMIMSGSIVQLGENARPPMPMGL